MKLDPREKWRRAHLDYYADWARKYRAKNKRLKELWEQFQSGQISEEEFKIQSSIIK